MQPTMQPAELVDEPPAEPANSGGMGEEVGGAVMGGWLEAETAEVAGWAGVVIMKVTAAAPPYLQS